MAEPIRVLRKRANSSYEQCDGCGGKWDWNNKGYEIQVHKNKMVLCPSCGDVLADELIRERENAK